MPSTRTAPPAALRRRARLGVRIGAGLLSCAGVAGGHQPFESSAVARIEGEQLEIAVTTSEEIALQLAGDSVVNAGGLETLRPQLKEIAAELYEVTADGKPLRPERVFFASRNGEAIFSALYPVARPAELRFRAAYLEKLPFGYGASLVMFDDAGKPIDHQPLLRQASDTFSVRVPAIVPIEAPTPTAPVEQQKSFAPTGQAGLPSRRRWPVPLLAGLGAVLFLSVLIARRFQKSGN